MEIAVVLLCVFSLFLFFDSRNKRKENKELKVEIAEKTGKPGTLKNTMHQLVGYRCVLWEFEFMGNKSDVIEQKDFPSGDGLIASYTDVHKRIFSGLSFDPETEIIPDGKTQYVIKLSSQGIAYLCKAERHFKS